MTKLKGKLTISRVTSNKEEDYIEIALVDDLAAVEAVSIKVDMLTYAKLLTNSAYLPVEFDFNDSGRVGTIHEHKDELVPRPSFLSRQDENAIANALKPYEVDGWRGRVSDMTNGHRHVRQAEQDYQRVTFDRNVPRAS